MDKVTDTIIQNEAKCLSCDDIIWSGNRHDYKECSCGAIAVDGGMEYIRRVFLDRNLYEERSLSTNKDNLAAVVSSFHYLRKVETCDNPALASYVIGMYGAEEDNEIVSVAATEAVKWGMETGRNSFGMVLAVIRSLRDLGSLDMEKFGNGIDDA